MEVFIGTIQPFAFNFAPVNWQLCNGQTLAISQFQALFSLIGTTYGGNGTTTFQLPNLQGRTIVGQGTGQGLPTIIMGEVAGANSASVTISNLPAHTHIASVSGGTPATVTVNGSPSVGTSGTPNGNYIGIPTGSGRGQGTYVLPASAGTVGPIAGVTVTGGSVGTVTNAPTGSNIPLNIQNPYCGINFCICMNGIFPSRN